MKMNKTSNLLVIFIIILAAIASAYGFFQIMLSMKIKQFKLLIMKPSRFMEKDYIIMNQYLWQHK
ncbi:hypothetical protein [Clostridium kluyveri]|uniref:Uncharacterized protein n=1 Tax=Clostridium kluyveri (strain ATCC 8527 / DSM 555 / NBRC 12016 / NCIMB 10680 / K1) TaxID=431943 RepID=A5N0F3_CLOK5|nr:hypothetical protein [Clostridium kluyveri]EDK34599.1 Hypothetical protein CKL_2587 [Clostridium kluyveri DSM 555]